MKHDVYIETDIPNTYNVLSFRNQSIAECVFEAARKWGKNTFVLSYYPQ